MVKTLDSNILDCEITPHSLEEISNEEFISFLLEKGAPLFKKVSSNYFQGTPLPRFTVWKSALF